jgi:hypothetical protein
MDEGFRIMMNVVHGGQGEAAIGDRGKVVFETRGSLKIPQFQREAREGGDT